MKEVNIMLMGETGVGKSTFVNAFANYLTFDTVQAALDAPSLVSLIPMQFDYVNPTTRERRRIAVGNQDDRNEVLEGGHSATQCCRTYSFPIPHANINVQLIDMPGVGNTRGIQQDKENFAQMISYLHNYDNIHGICILLAPTHTRLTDSFEYCFKENLRQLDKSVCSNIVFLFTKARASDYTPGDTRIPLLALLKEIESSPSKVRIAFQEVSGAGQPSQNVFCMDNEGFSCVVACKQGCSYTPRQLRNFEDSWEQSAQQSQCMLDHILSSPPHSTSKIISLSRASKIVALLQEPMLAVAEKMDKNLAKLEGEVEMQEEEQNKMIRASACYTVFVMRNAIIPYSDKIRINMQQQIQEAAIAHDSVKAQRLKELLDVYDKQVNEMSASDPDVLSPENIMQMYCPQSLMC